MKRAIRLNYEGKGELGLLQEGMRNRGGVQRRAYILRRAVGIGRRVDAGLDSSQPQDARSVASHTYTWRQNDGGRRVVKFCGAEGLRKEVRRIELVEGNGARNLGRLRLHLMRIPHTHCAELLGHLRNGRRRRRVSRSCRLHLGRVRAVHGLLVHGGLGLGLGISSTSYRLASQSGIGTGAKFKRLARIRPLLLSPGLTLSSRRGRSRGLLNGGAIATTRLTVPFLRRVTPLRSCHGEITV